MVRTLLLRGMLVGVVAGLLAFGFAKLFGEAQIDNAIAFEDQMHQSIGMAPEMELVSREMQRTIGLFTGVVVYGAALGGLFALTFAYAYGRIASLGARDTAALLAAAGLVAIVLVPALKYPPNPPSVGQADTIGYRTGMYFLMMLISLAAMIAAIAIGRRLAGRYGIWNAALIAAAGVRRGYRRRAAPVAGHQRSAGSFSGRRPVAVPARVARDPNRPVDDDGLVVRRAGGAKYHRWGA